VNGSNGVLGLVRKLVIRVRRRGARLARREEEEYSTYCDDEQRSQPGWIGGEIVSIISGRALSTGRDWTSLPSIETVDPESAIIEHWSIHDGRRPSDGIASVK
jgi:hypothetical protein